MELVRFVFYVYYLGSWVQGEFKYRKIKVGGQIGIWFSYLG